MMPAFFGKGTSEHKTLDLTASLELISRATPG